jgi:hypothetical protein
VAAPSIASIPRPMLRITISGSAASVPGAKTLNMSLASRISSPVIGTTSAVETREAKRNSAQSRHGRARPERN